MKDKSDAERLFLTELETIDRVIRHAARRGALYDDDGDDFASYVRLKLVENDYGIIRRYEARASFAAFISVVVQRLLLDYRITKWGKWHASAEAKRIGELAITIEAMMIRDGRTLEEALPALVRRWPEVTRDTVEGITRRLPQRTPRPRIVDLRTARDTLETCNWPEGDAIAASEVAAMASRIEAVVRATLHELADRDRLLFRLRFERALSVAEISRMLAIEQKPLYRQLHRVLQLLRKRLEAAGVTAADAVAIVTSRTDLDFGFAMQAAMADSAPTEEEGD